MDQITKDVEHAIRWLAVEYHFLEQLHTDLERIEQEDGTRQERDLAKDVRILNYIGNAERVVNNDLERIRKELQQEGESDVQVQELLAQIEVPAAQLLKNGAKYVGALREKLEGIQQMMAAEKRQNIARYQSTVGKEIKKQELEIEDLEKWIAMLDVVLKKIPAQQKNMSRRDFLKMAIVGGATVAAIGFERKAKAFHRGSGLLDKHIFGSNEIYRLPGKNVYLTIDDGPVSLQQEVDFNILDKKAHLEVLMEYLLKKGYGAIFFWVGRRLEMALRNDGYRMLLIECVRKGFIIGNHSYTHRAFSSLSSVEILNEIDKTEERIAWLYKEAGVRRPYKLLRFPYGDRPTFFERSEVYNGIVERGYQIMFWSKDTLDWKKESTVASVTQKVAALRAGDIVLIHELPRTIDEFLDPLCQKIAEQGFVMDKCKKLV